MSAALDLMVSATLDIFSLMVGVGGKFNNDPEKINLISPRLDN